MYRDVSKHLSPRGDLFAPKSSSQLAPTPLARTYPQRAALSKISWKPTCIKTSGELLGRPPAALLSTCYKWHRKPYESIASRLPLTL